MSDAELDREYKPSGRPTSTMAQSFSLALNDLFKIDNSLADLDAAVSEKKKAVSTQTSELEALEARIKATEERLRQAATAGPQLSPRQRAPLADTFAQKGYPTSPLSAEFRQEKGYPVGGHLPPTPGASEDGDVPRQK
ncbi:hypothetical protein LZ554_005907 [Drepanopeziza brunnea f. sp. 'monogermtubi']|nr:hypothetical protein LZ554_005907 [Drepanopeziza brunnea f. sp. 'monogermtubi']